MTKLQHRINYITVALLLVVAMVSAYPKFRERIPNAFNVASPCDANDLWKAIGHRNQEGGGPWNVFGLDFNDVGLKMWTKTLCEMDSDGDGMSNGEELGDPNCIWAPGQEPERTTHITHPGVCNPVGVGICVGKDEWLVCKTDKFECDAVNETNVKSFDLVYPKTLVPNQETNYVCFNFDIPTNQSFYLRAYEPLIDNWDVMHHIVVRGCRDASTAPLVDEPFVCGMASASCPETIALWTIGVNGYCFPKDVGIPFGASGFKRFQLEFHWNNPYLMNDYHDGSGMRFYYEQYRTGMMGAGLYYISNRMLNIPPGQSDHEETTTCPGSCTAQHLTGPINIISAVNHMHLIGKSQTTTLWRNGTFIATIANDHSYNYNSPVVHNFKPPIQMLPGDDLKTVCTFDSSNQNRLIRYGDATSDEMCVAYLVFYPLANARKFACPVYNPLSICDLESGKHLGSCDWKNFTRLLSPEAYTMAWNLARNCDLNGMCREECLPVVKQVMEHPCMQEQYRQFITAMMDDSVAGLRFLGRLSSCSTECPARPWKPDDDDDWSRASAGSVAGSLAAFMVIVGFGLWIE